MGSLARLVNPIGKLHGRLMELARERGVAQGRKLRVGVMHFVPHRPDKQLAGRVHRQVGSRDVALVRGGIEPEAARITVVQAIETNCVVFYKEVVPEL